jgi:3-phenylpropionate/trans-cinnamate dioxygenase ferredoxin reductase subunit
MSETNHGQGPDLRVGVALGDLRENQPLLGHVDDEPVLLVRQGRDIHAVSARCTHYGGPLQEGLVADGGIHCPWHHACFDLASGAVRSGPAPEALRCWAVRSEHGRVQVDGERTPPAPKPKHAPRSVLIVGAGAAGDAAAHELRACGYHGPITLLAGEADTPVDRPNLSKDYLAGKAPAEWLPLRSADYWRERRIERIHARAERLDLAGKAVHCDGARRYSYDALLLATGAQPIRLPIAGAELPHVHVLRTRADAEAIRAAIAAGAQRAVIIGASFIGLEAAAALRTQGLQVDVVAPETQPLARVFGPRLADAVRDAHTRMGTRFHLGRKPASISATAVRLDDGSALPADLVIMGVGVRADVTLAQQAGLAVDNGILVGVDYRSGAPEVWAAGDIASVPDPATGVRRRIEHWAWAQTQGRQAARAMLGLPVTPAVPFFWSQHGELTISYVGHAAQWDALEEDGDPERGDYLCRYLQDGRVLAVASIGRDRDSLRAEVELQHAAASPR